MEPPGAARSQAHSTPRIMNEHLPTSAELATLAMKQLALETLEYNRIRDALLADLDRYTRLAGKVPELPKTFCDDCDAAIPDNRGYYVVFRVAPVTGLRTVGVRLCLLCTATAYPDVAEAVDTTETRRENE